MTPQPPPDKRRKVAPELVELPRCPNCNESAIIRGTCVRCGYSEPIR